MNFDYPEDTRPSILLKLSYLWRRELVFSLSLQETNGKARSEAWAELLAVRSSDVAAMQVETLR